MSNPVFSKSAVFGEPREKGNRTVPASTGQPQQPGYLESYYTGQPQQQAASSATVDAAQLDQMFGAPSATSRDTGRLTYDDVIVKTSGLLVLLAVVAAGSWRLAEQMPGLMLIGALVGLVLGLVNSFRKNPSPALIIAYTVAEGVFLGGISYYFQHLYIAQQNAQPIVLQAILGTLATFGAALFLFSSGKVRVTPKFTRWLLVAMVGYLGFSVLNVVLSFFLPGDFGPLRSGWVGVVVGLVAVGMAAASLIMDFDSIKRGVEGGAPAKFAWSAAFGLIVTLVWLYLEILRILAILQGRD